MNLLSIRDRLKAAGAHQIVTSKELHSILHAPVFVLPPNDDLTDAEMDWLKENVLDEGEQVPRNLPFPEMLIVNPHSTVAVWRYSDGISTLFNPLEGPPGDLMRCLYRFNQKKDGVKVNIYQDFKSVTPPKPPIEERMIALANFPAARVAALCLAVMASQSTVLRVEPPQKPGKSVEWRLARTHYLIVTRKQAVALQKSKGTISDHAIQRAAHWRRAHFRKLVAARFKSQRTVPVKHAWVGPDVWIGLDGKIYKVIDIKPLDNNTARGDSPPA